MQIVKKIKNQKNQFCRMTRRFQRIKTYKKTGGNKIKIKIKMECTKKEDKKKLRKKPIDGSSKAIVILLIKIYDVMKFLSKSQHFESKPEHTKKIPSRRRRRS